MAHTAGKGRKLTAWLQGRRASTLGYAAAAAGFACVAALFFVGESGRASSVHAVPSPGFNGGRGAAEPDALLFRALHEIGNNRLDAALTEIDGVIKTYPNFRLAHLIKGNLLRARARPLTTVGNAPGASRDKLNDLREEARARLARYQHERPRDRVPRYLLQLDERQRHARIVDTARSTLSPHVSRVVGARRIVEACAAN